MARCINMMTLKQGQDALLSGMTMNLTNMILIVIGSITAGIGLLHNNFMVIMGSMLLSPIGNSIIRFSLGYIYLNRKMMMEGFISMIAQFILGFVFGYIIGIINIEMGETVKMPTEEMEKRVKDRNYKIDYLLSLLMGFILAYSLIYTQSTALVGLRLSLAVLPALVNGGLYISMAHYEKDIKKYEEYIESAKKMFRLVTINLLGVLFTTVIGFHYFC